MTPHNDYEDPEDGLALNTEFKAFTLRNDPPEAAPKTTTKPKKKSNEQTLI